MLLGTSNRGKAAEFGQLLAAAGLELLTLDLTGSLDVAGLDGAGPAPAVEETGHTLAENAVLKSTAYARHFRCWTLADDTALCVAALGGAPGLHTARFAGPQATAADNRAKLLAELKNFPLARPAAYFECQLALADPDGNVQATGQGRCHGRILLEPAGALGFGYDSLFELLEYHRTFAQLGPAKQLLSHRARAAEQILPELRRMLG